MAMADENDNTTQDTIDPNNPPDNTGKLDPDTPASDLPPETVVNKIGDPVSPGQRVIDSDGKQGAVARVLADGEEDPEGNAGKGETVRVQLDEAVDGDRWAWYKADDLRLL